MSARTELLFRFAANVKPIRINGTITGIRIETKKWLASPLGMFLSARLKGPPKTFQVVPFGVAGTVSGVILKIQLRAQVRIGACDRHCSNVGSTLLCHEFGHFPWLALRFARFPFQRTLPNQVGLFDGGNQFEQTGETLVELLAAQ